MRVRSLLLPVGFAALVAVGCSSTDTTGTSTDGGGSTSPTTVAATTPPKTGTSAPSGTSAPAPTGATAITVVDSPLGRILVDGTGMTVYAFMKDTATTSACTDGCVQAWPAVAGESVEAGAGLDAEDFTTITGADGATQIVFYGHPLYTYAGDNGPGDTTGQGVGGNWFVVGVDGNPVQPTP